MPKLTLDGIVKVLGLRGNLLRRAAFALAVLLGAGVALSVPAHAQSNDDDFTPLNSRIKRERQFPTEPPNRHGPEQMSKVNRERSKAMLGQFGKCLYNRSHEKSLDLLEKTDFGFVSFEQVNMDTDKAMKILGFMDCLGRVADTHQSGVRLNFSAGGVRQWLLQEAYFARYPDGPTWLTPGNVIAERHYPLSDSNRGVRSAMDLADCVVAADPYGADYLYRVPADSEGEKAALNSLLPALGPCVPEGLQLQIEPYTFRVWMGEALWQASNHNVPAEAAGSGGSPVMPKLTVDGIEVEVPAGATILQACEAAGKEIPRFCYHERLSIAGNCRMCLVEVKPGPPKPQASCALPAGEGQEVRTDSEMVKKAREGVMEFLLINHPLDCPICDQGGECDLQDQAVAYGRGHSRYDEHKRAVTEKYMGPLIKTVMTRCIHCTRCVRFSEEVAGVDEIGALYRGENMQITTYLEHAAKHELSANVIDLCPVGALTSRPYAFEARPWELKKTLAIDVSDAVGSNIRVDSRGREVLRVLPRTNDDVNEEWISDKARYQVEGLTRRRLDKPWIRKNGRLEAADWNEAFTAIAAVSPGNSIAAVAGDMLDCETMFAAKRLVNALGSKLVESRQGGMDYDTSSLAAVNFNSTFAGIETADAILVIGSHIRWEAPLVNVRLRKAQKRGAKIFIVGPEWETTYPATFLGADVSVLGRLPQDVSDAMAGAERPAIILGGGGIVAGAHGAALDLAAQWKVVRKGWNGFNVLHMAAARMGALMLGFSSKGGMADLAKAKPKLLLALGADEVDFTSFEGALKVYIGHHGDKGAHAADIVLPGSAFTEKAGTYVNTEGRVQFADKAVFAPGDAREDWTILRALADALGISVGFDSFVELQSAMIAEVPALGEEGLADYGQKLPKGSPKASGEIRYPILDFYLTNPIARASGTMQQCSAELLHGEELVEAAE